MPFRIFMDGVNTNTYVSVGILVTVVGAAIWINTTAIGIKAELATTKIEIVSQISGIDKRVSLIEGNKAAWTQTDMYKWSNRLQRENQPINLKGLNVPEPEHSTQ